MKPIHLNFQCYTLTPMFVSGANSNIPSLQANSVKGMLRYWWRAINVDLDLRTMKRMEQRIFGGMGTGKESARRSAVVVRIPQSNMVEEWMPLLPHREETGGDTSDREGFIEFQGFVIELSLLEESIYLNVDGVEMELMNAEKLKALMMCWAILGGIGKRTRRGMGSFYIDAINDEEIYWPKDLERIPNLLNTVTVSEKGKAKNVFEYSANAKRIRMTNRYTHLQRRFTRYPFIREIRFSGRSYKNTEKLLTKIGVTSHKLLEEYGRDYRTVLGSGRPRQASPIYVSTLDEKTPIITCLNTLLRPHQQDLKYIQQEFINKILYEK